MGGRGSSGGGGGGVSSSERKSIIGRLPDTPKGFSMSDAPKLTGTEKQVKWANSIRKQIAEDLFDYAVTRTSDGRRSDVMETVFGGKQAMMKSIADSPLVSMTSGAVRAQKIDSQISGFTDAARRYERATSVITSHTSASWWIDNRNNVGFNHGRNKLRDIVDGK